MKKQKLNYRFHDPNDPAVTAEYILKVFIEVNQKKVEEAIRKASEKEQIPEQESEVTKQENSIPKGGERKNVKKNTVKRFSR